MENGHQYLIGMNVGKTTAILFFFQMTRSAELWLEGKFIFARMQLVVGNGICLIKSSTPNSVMFFLVLLKRKTFR